MTKYKPTCPVPWIQEGLDYLRANFTPAANSLFAGGLMECDGITFEPSFGADDFCSQLGIPFSELPMCV